MFNSKLLVIYTLAFFLATPSWAASEQVNPTQRAGQRTATFEPCQYWNYDFQANSYVCGFKGFMITVYSAQEVKSLIGGLETRIKELELRLAKVETKQP